MGRFDFGHGGVACGDCVGGGPRVGPRAREEMRLLIQRGSEPSIDRTAASFSTSHLKPHLKLLADFATYHVSDGRRIAAFDYFLETLPPEPKAENPA